MAEHNQTHGSSSSPRTESDCAVCLQKCHHPTELPCGHIFCFLCVKGVAIQNRKCAMCRAVIPPDYLDHPKILEKLTDNQENTAEFQWYYEGRNGWWKYDERSNEELEEAFITGAADCTLLLAGSLYIIDFQNMIQKRQNDQSKIRHICRDTPMLPAKGIAGIKIERNVNDAKTEDAESVPEDTDLHQDSEPSQTVGNEEQDRQNQDEIEDIIETINSLHFNQSITESNDGSSQT